MHVRTTRGHRGCETHRLYAERVLPAVSLLTVELQAGWAGNEVLVSLRAKTMTSEPAMSAVSLSTAFRMSGIKHDIVHSLKALNRPAVLKHAASVLCTKLAALDHGWHDKRGTHGGALENADNAGTTLERPPGPSANHSCHRPALSCRGQRLGIVEDAEDVDLEFGEGLLEGGLDGRLE